MWFFFSNQTGSLRFCWILILPFKNWIFKVLFGKSNLSTLFTNQLSEAMRDVNSMNGRDVRIHHSPFVELETDMDVSENNGTPKTSILIGFSKINHPFWGTPIFQKPPDIQWNRDSNQSVQCIIYPDRAALCGTKCAHEPTLLISRSSRM